jgi:predicted nucleotidyltransferase
MERNVAATLAHLGEERDRLLSRVQQVLEADRRVTAAWLSGSYGRGEADAWSDLDLHVAVMDEHFEEFIADHQTLFANCGQQLHVISHGIPSWSMPHGRFWLVQYAPYMLEVDWNIGPTAATTRPEASYMLFDRVGIPITPPLPPVEEDFRRAEAKNQLDFFWAMAPIAVKFTGRGHTRLAVEQVDLLQGAFIRIWRALWRPELLQKDAYHQNRPLEAELDVRLPRFGPKVDPLAALNVIRAYCDEVVSWHPALAELGVSVRDEVVSEVAALAEVAEKSARMGGSNPDQGSRR